LTPAAEIEGQEATSVVDQVLKGIQAPR
jgi:hypothetical protein